MSAKIIDGKAIAKEIVDNARIQSQKLRESGIIPCLAVILVGNDPASISYVEGKKKALQNALMENRFVHFDETASEEMLLSCISDFNNDKNIHGILVQLPLPKHIDTQKIISAIDYKKDVDGFNPINTGALVTGGEGFVPCTPRGIVTLLEHSGAKIDGSYTVVVGRSNIVGKPVALLLSQRRYNATVTLCHTGTRDLSYFTKQADIVIVAAGKPQIITASMVKVGSTIIDVGINRIRDTTRKSGFRLVGDVDFNSVKEVANAITPVPGGVGPMTIAMLIQNTLEASKNLND